MGSYRCSTCALNYPTYGQCRVCYEKLDWITGQEATPDLEDQIRLRNASTRLDSSEQERNWRTKQFYTAGYPYEYAVRMAKEQEIDLHKACELLEAGCDVSVALEILL